MNALNGPLVNNEAPIDISRWTVSAKTSDALTYPITGVTFSPKRKGCIVLYVKLPIEVEHLNITRRQKILDNLGIVEDPNEDVEDDYPLILVNKTKGSRTMRDMNRYAFYKNFRTYTRRLGIDIENPYSARAHLIGANVQTKFIQMRKINTDVRFWAPDRIGIELV